jgi:hypothetical protein
MLRFFVTDDGIDFVRCIEIGAFFVGEDCVIDATPAFASSAVVVAHSLRNSPADTLGGVAASLSKCYATLGPCLSSAIHAGGCRWP